MELFLDSDFSDLEWDTFILEYLGSTPYRESTYNGLRRLTLNDLAAYSEQQCKELFRFTYPELVSLRAHLRLPEELTLENGSKIGSIMALAILLYRFARPRSLFDIEQKFGYPISTVSRTIKYVVDHICENFSHKLRDMNQPLLQVGHPCNIVIPSIRVRPRIRICCFEFFSNSKLGSHS